MSLNQNKQLQEYQTPDSASPPESSPNIMGMIDDLNGQQNFEFYDKNDDIMGLLDPNQQNDPNRASFPNQMSDMFDPNSRDSANSSGPLSFMNKHLQDGNFNGDNTREKGEMDRLIDLSNMKNLQNLNQLEDSGEYQRNLNQQLARSNESKTSNPIIEQDEMIQGDNVIDVDNIEVDLNDDEFEEMARIMRQNVNFPQKQAYINQKDLQDKKLLKDPIEKSKSAQGLVQNQKQQFSMQDVIVDTPPSNYNYNDSELMSNSLSIENQNNKSSNQQFFESQESHLLDAETRKLKKLEQQKKLQFSQQQQIQKELRELLAQSSSEQLLLINDENEKMNHLAVKHEQINMEEDILMGEQPLDNLSKRLNSENFMSERQENTNGEIDDVTPVISPPLVTSKGGTLNNSEGRDKSDKQSLEGKDLRPSFQNVSPKAVDKEKQRPKETPIPEVSKTTPVETKPAPSSQALLGADIPAQKQKKPSRDLAAEPAKEKEEAPATAGEENDSFHRLYNKEIKVNQDEIPLLLLELTDIAYKFIKKDQYEKAYVLLQKTESVLEVVNLEHSKRDKYFAYITYHNMAMCFQKLGMLEECIIYLKETIQVLDKSNFFKDVNISQRMKQMHMQCQLKLQLCAILSQTQKHTEAMDNAKYSVRLGHQILRDMYDLCVFYSNKIKFKDDFASLSLLLMDEADDPANKGGEEAKKGKHTKSEIDEKMMHKKYIRENSPVRDIPYNILEESISMIERTALKLLPIMKELGNRLAGTNGKKGLDAFHAAPGLGDKQLADKDKGFDKNKLGSDIEKKVKTNDKGMLLNEDEDQQVQKMPDEKPSKNEDQIDMRTVLGFLNQNEWILNLNIGNIMQMSPVRMKDFMQTYRNEHQLSRESFLEKLQLLIVSYFCVSTEMRFIIASRSGFMKPEVKKEKELEQEYWHVKALDISCAFLPSECPLFNHILLSYQKHHDPTMHQIDEDQEQDDIISVLRPLRGIENSKYQPLIRELTNVYIDVPELPLSPLSKCFDQRLVPKKVKTTSMNIQTDPIQEPEGPEMKSQSVNIQDDLLPEEAKLDQEPEKPKDDKKIEIFDSKNAYLDLSSSKYQEKLISKIIDDPNINDKQGFLNKLILRVNSQDPEKFQVNNGSYLNGNTYANSHNLNSQSSVLYQNAPIDGTLSANPSGNNITEIYGGKKGQMNKGTKFTQSGQLSYNKQKSKQNTKFDPIDFKSFDQKSQYVNPNNHVKSLYGDTSSNDATAIGGAVKHHIASQSLAPSQSVFTDQRGYNKQTIKTQKQSQQLIVHKKNQSISGGNSEDIFRGTNPKFGKNTIEQSSQSIITKYGATKKKQKSVEAKILNNDSRQQMMQNNKNIKIQSQGTNKLLRGINSQNINLSNQKLNTQHKKPAKYLQNNFMPQKSDDRPSAKGNQLDKQQVSKNSQKMHMIPTANSKNQDFLMKELNDVMSQSSSNDSNPDPDLHPMPESSCSEAGGNLTQLAGKISPSKFLRPNDVSDPNCQSQEESLMASDNRTNKQTQNKQSDLQMKQRPSSAITNYTTSGYSAVRTAIGTQKAGKQSKQRLQQAQSTLNQTNKGQSSKQVQKIQQQQNIITTMKQSKQRQLYNGAPIVQKKKTKVLSRKKYGSDRSSNSPLQDHAYSIAQQPMSIFDSGNTHSISKISNQQSKKSIGNIDQHPMQILQNQQNKITMLNQNQLSKGQIRDQAARKKSQNNNKFPAQSNHSNSQTINIDKKLRKQQSQKQENLIVQNQSENILAKLQNLLNKDDPNATSNNKKQALNLAAHGKASATAHNSHNRKSAQSGGPSQTRQSRHSYNSRQSRQSRYSRQSRSKSRISRSKSSGKSGRGQQNKQSKSQSNERKAPHQPDNAFQKLNRSSVDPNLFNVNNSLIQKSQNYNDSLIDSQDQNQSSFEMRQILGDMQTAQFPPDTKSKRKRGTTAMRNRPKSSLLLVENQKSDMSMIHQSQKQISKKKSTKKQQKAHNNSIENLQRQVLENQKILLQNAQKSNKVTKRNANNVSKNNHHNHNNSISHISNIHNQNLTAGAQTTNMKGSMNTQNFRNNMNKSVLSSGTSGTKKKQSVSRKQQVLGLNNGNKMQSQNILNSYNTSQILNHLAHNMQNLQRNELKMTQQNLSQGFKNFPPRSGVNHQGTNSTQNSTAGQYLSGKSTKSRKTNGQKPLQHRRGSLNNNTHNQVSEFINFEQMQQQIEQQNSQNMVPGQGGFALGGVDLMKQESASDLGTRPSQNTMMMAMEMQPMNDHQKMGFIPHKNLMPKTTGSQAHLLNIQEANNLQKQYNSLNQTGRTSGNSKKQY